MKQPGQVRFNLTPAMKRALHLVNSGNVRHLTTPDGNVMKWANGTTTPRMLWSLFAMHFIEPDPATEKRGAITTVRMRLTRTGIAVMGN